MNGTFSEALTYCHEQLTDCAGVPVTYTRGSESCQLDARPADCTVVSQTENGTVEDWLGVDWMVSPPEQLAFAAGAVLPALGDKITWFLNGTTRTFQVLAPPGSKRCYEHGAYQACLTIHTKEVAS